MSVYRVVTLDGNEILRSLDLFVVCARWVKDPDRQRVEEMQVGTNTVLREVARKECCATLRSGLPGNKHLHATERTDLEDAVRKACGSS